MTKSKAALLLAGIRRLFCWHRWSGIEVYRITDPAYRAIPGWGVERIRAFCSKCGKRISMETGRK